jgi:outer membrane receptor protein involved in Fe transport
VDPLVRAKGAIGLRSAIVPKLQTTLALWRLDVASELLFVGDAGTTEPSRPNRRSGLEWANWWTPRDWLTIDADFAWSRARFNNDDPAGNRIPGAIEKTVSVGVSVDNLNRWFGGLRLRRFGARPLIEDNSVHSPPSTLVNLRVGYRFDRQLKLTLDVLNLFDRKVSDIDYWYESRVTPDSAAAFGLPAEPRTLRLALQAGF